jgi:Tfp pilus assembly protein PilO
MNQELQKNFFVKISVVIIAVSAAWYIFVGPKLEAVKESNQKFASQTNEISNGEQEIVLYGKALDNTIESMESIREGFVNQLAIGQDSNARQSINEFASNNKLTVTRIEPLRTTSNKLVNEYDLSEIVLETEEFRVECMGSYSGLVGYLQDLTQGSQLSSVSTFRILPISKNNAKMILQVSVFSLTEAPEGFVKPAETPVITKAAAVGEHNDDT